MKLSISKIGSGVKTFYAVAAACVGLIVAGWVGSRAYDSFMGQFDVVLDSIAVVRENVHYINVEQSFMAEDLMSIHDSLDKIGNGVGNNTDAINQLIWVEQHRDGFTPEQIELILDDFLKKNFAWTGHENNMTTPLMCTDYETITEQENMNLYSNPLTP